VLNESHVANDIPLIEQTVSLKGNKFKIKGKPKDIIVEIENLTIKVKLLENMKTKI
jgi:hypothetical protein